jgi:hypothetical protein
MDIISPQECEEWLATSLGSGDARRNTATVFEHSVTYGLPLDTGQKTVLARLLSNSIDADRPGLFWITGWGIFSNHQNMALFDGYRRSLGESRLLYAAPGHVFRKPDLRDLECLLDLVLYFYWDAMLFDGAGTVAVRISHDEFVSIHTMDARLLTRFVDSLDGLTLKQWK